MSFFHALLTGGGGYYVAQAGTGSGVTAADPMSPADFLLETLVSGDTVYFKRGDTFEFGEYDITASGVKIKAYGAGASPIFDGSTSISGLSWASLGSDIYSTAMVTEPSWIWIGGICAKMAQSNDITITSRPSTTQIGVTHATVSGFPNLIGSYLVARESNFKFSRLVTVTGYNGAGTITIDLPISVGSASVPNVNLALLNRADYLNGNNQWYWESGTLYVRAAASPSTLNIRVGAYDYAFRDEGNTTFRNLEIKNYYQFGITSFNGVTDAEGLNIHDIRDTGVVIQKAVDGANISGNTLLRCGNNAIAMRSCSNSTFNRNTISSPGMQDNYGWHTWQSGASYFNQPNGCGIVQMIDPDDDAISGTNCQYEYNVITNTCYCGISQAVGSDEIVRYNSISDICNRLVDGGGVYTFHFRDYNVPNDNAEIAYNTVTDDNHAVSVIGIYLDNRTTNANVHHNTVSGFEWGILQNWGTEGHTIEDNNIIDNTYGVVFRVSDSPIGLYDNEGMNLNRNVIASGKNQKALLFRVQSGSFPTWSPFTDGGADNNTYIKNAAPNSTFIADSDNQGNNLTLAALQAAYGEDAASVYLQRNPVLFTNYAATTLNTNANAYYQDFSGVAVNAYSIDPYYSRILNELNYSNEFVAASTQYFNAGTTADIQFTNASTFSIVLRFKRNGVPVGVETLLDNRNASNRGYTIQLLTTGAYQIHLVNTTTTNRLLLQGTVNLCDNNWHQIIFSYTSTTNVVDVDGVLDSPTIGDNLTATIASVNNLNIGRNTQGGTNYFTGLLDEISIWTSTQSGNRTTHWNGGRAIDIRTVGIGTPLHYWRMGLPISTEDEGTGTHLDLTAVNGPTASTDAP